MPVTSAEHSPLMADVERGKSGLLEDNGIHKGWLRRHVQHAFGHESNPKFAEHAEHAFRGACALVFFAIPLLMPKGVLPFRDYLIELGVYNSGVCLFIIFNLGSSFGQAFNSCRSGLQGNFAAALLGWTMYTIFPDGVTEDLDNPELAFWGGVATGTIFVSLLICLKFSISMQMFALSGFAGTWMQFLDASKSADIIPPWRPGWSIGRDVLTQSFACTGIGMLAVMLASLLPYPRWSLVFVTENQLHANVQMVKVMRTVVDYYALDKPNKYIKDQVIRRLGQLKGLTHENQPLLAAAWWECYGFGSSQVKRRVLAQMDIITSSIFDIIWNAWQETVAEDFGEKDGRLIRQIKPYLDQLLKSMEVTLNLLVKAASDGSLTPAEVRALQMSFEDIGKKDKELVDFFRKARKEVTKGSPEVIYKDIRIAHVLIYSFSEVVGQTKGLADKVHQEMSKSYALPPPPELDGFKSIFTGLTEKTHMVYAARGMIAFFGSFILGWFGFRDVFPPHTAGIASTVPFLITMYVGSALVSDLNRIQGLMLGYVMAPILASLTATCEPVDLIIHLSITFLWVFLGVFVRESSPTFSSIGSMAAAFGASTLLAKNCSDPTIDKASIFVSLALNCIAVLVTTVVNLMIPAESASELAVNSLEKCWALLRKSIEELYDPNMKTVTFRASEAQAALQSARAMGMEAASEPRFWKLPWKVSLFEAVVEDTARMVATLSAMEHAVTGGEVNGPKKESLYRLMQKSNLFRHSAQSTVLKKMDVGTKLIGIFRHSTAKRYPALSDKDVYKTYEEDDARAEEEFVSQDLGKIFGADNDRETNSVRDDDMAVMATALANLSRMKEQLRCVQHRILQNSYDE